MLMGEKKKLEEATQSGSVDGMTDPPSPVRRHVKWKMAHMKKTEEMKTKAAKETVEKIVSHFELTIRIIFQYFVNAMCRNSALLRASEARLTGALSKGGKMRGVATNVYLWKTSEKPKETGQKEYSKFGSCIYV